MKEPKFKVGDEVWCCGEGDEEKGYQRVIASFERDALDGAIWVRMTDGWEGYSEVVFHTKEELILFLLSNMESYGKHIKNGIKVIKDIMEAREND